MAISDDWILFEQNNLNYHDIRQLYTYITHIIV